MNRRFRRLPQVVPVRALVPTMLTLLALCSGVTAIRFAILERWEAAVVALLLAALLDSLDGRVARLIKGESRFGAELDSLSDMICFGVAPGLVVYLWTLHGIKGLGWAVVLLFAVCCALRLARFNIMDQDALATGTVQRYFVGVPAPSAAMLAVAPMAVTFHWDTSFFREPVVIAIYGAVVALLMVSRIPSLSLKQIRIDRSYVVPILIGVGVTAALLTSYFWATLSIMAVLYMASLPLAWFLAGRDDSDAGPSDADASDAKA